MNSQGRTVYVTTIIESLPEFEIKFSVMANFLLGICLGTFHGLGGLRNAENPTPRQSLNEIFTSSICHASQFALHEEKLLKKFTS